MVSLSGAWRFLRHVGSDVSEKNVTFMAAGIAYNAFISLAPTLVLLFLVLSAVGGGLEERIVEASGEWLPGPIADVVGQLFQGDPAVGGASVVGLVVLVWGTLKIFRGLDTAFSEIYETEGGNTFVDKLKDGIVVFVALVAAVVATVGLTAAFAAFSDRIPFVGALTPLLLVVGLVVAFLPMFYVFPDTELGLRDVLPGVLFAAVGWAAFQGLFQVYLEFSDPGAGSFFGGVIVVVTYLYFSGLVLLIGAVINSVVGGHSTGKPGGVGRGATSYEAEREGSLNRDELAAYLRDLREGLTGHYEGTRPTAEGEERPRPRGPVELSEHSSLEDGTRRWTVTLSWEADESEPGSTSPAGRDAEATPDEPHDSAGRSSGDRLGG
ncbi:YhjD/YihY/BrkB family envelope integrity protein [Halorarum salinum]|uniref:YihY/virulence factor BrkB family protein n=1 Tax=Halorarum salinum TaxID=2743089 RepID=A0A7D5LC39_9EURY|nr:YhjD/YihY/BrkB family envelope integrity protein [Halobaculum salinum]QLG63011.1 YihY/virulence factor BrkB family protein [Halobaculum salinum]